MLNLEMKELKKRIDNVIEGKTDGVLARGCAPYIIVDYMKSLGYQYFMKTSGWQNDFWIYFQKEEINMFVLEGCWFYGTQSFERITIE